jgi:hypothetical protein
MLAYMDKEIKDAHWKTALKATVEECHKEVKAQKDKILGELEKAPFNVKKDQCNALPMAMITCIHLEGFVVSRNWHQLDFIHFGVLFQRCPKESWTEEKRCADGKAWIQKCGREVESFKQLVEKASK